MEETVDETIDRLRWQKKLNQRSTGGCPGWTLLHYAAYCGEPEAVAALLKRGTFVDSMTFGHSPSTPLALCVIGSREPVPEKSHEAECARLLLNAGAQLQLIDDYRIPGWAYEYDARRKARNVAKILLGIRQCRHTILDTNVRNVIVFIAQYVKSGWSSWDQRIKSLCSV